MADALLLALNRAEKFVSAAKQLRPAL